jgi:peptidoglycan/xylan/chitin deacetylase (PgdA/CDA1 family)
VLDDRHDIRDQALALTFDDGPSVWTEQILDLLESYDARATFFVLAAEIVGDSERATLRRILDAGSEIGNHTFSHPSLPTLDDGAIRDELERSGSLIQGPWDWEWDANRTAEFVIERLRRGSIVCMHDGRPAAEPADVSAPTREATVAAVGTILDAMSKRGLRSVTISELRLSE